jgi:hypothetical protein
MGIVVKHIPRQCLFVSHEKNSKEADAKDVQGDDDRCDGGDRVF